MNLANKITMFRILLLPIFVLSYYYDQSGISSLAIFLLGSFSDFLDGYVARKYDTTQFFSVIFFFLTIILINRNMYIIGKVLLYISVALTVLSMINYLYKNKEVFNGTMQ